MYRLESEINVTQINTSIAECRSSRTQGVLIFPNFEFKKTGCDGIPLHTTALNTLLHRSVRIPFDFCERESKLIF